MRLKKWMRNVFTVIVLAVFLFSAYRVLVYNIESKKNADSVSYLADVAVLPLPTAEMPMFTVNTPEPPAPDAGPMPEYPPIWVDFEALKEESDDVVGWLYCEDTPINYPVMQSEDNGFYLERLYDGSYNPGGSLFLDYKCQPDFSEFCPVVYGHNMTDGAMFGTLSDYKEQSYYEAHPVMYLLTPEKNYRLDLISGFVSKVDSIAYSPKTSLFEKESFLKTCAEISTFTPEQSYSLEDRFLLLSTCSYEFDNARYVLVGKLVEIDMPERPQAIWKLRSPASISAEI